MPPVYDLHSHSTASDGELPPADLVRRAVRNGVHCLAVTDHDVTDGIAAAQDAARSLGCMLIPGVEISVTWCERLIHVVGLGVDPRCRVLDAGLAHLRAIRRERAQAIGARLERLGIPGALAGAEAIAQGTVLSRTHFARFLVAEGRVRHVQHAFKRYLSRGQGGYASCTWAALDEAVHWIAAAGGQAVIAHPARYRLSGTEMERLVAEFKGAGGAALEVVSSSHTPADTHRMAALVRRHGLLASTGSDFHAPDNRWAELGRMPAIPHGCTPIWETWAAGATQGKVANLD